MRCQTIGCMLGCHATIGCYAIVLDAIALMRSAVGLVCLDCSLGVAWLDVRLVVEVTEEAKDGPGVEEGDVVEQPGVVALSQGHVVASMGDDHHKLDKL